MTKRGDCSHRHCHCSGEEEPDWPTPSSSTNPNNRAVCLPYVVGRMGCRVNSRVRAAGWRGGLVAHRMAKSGISKQVAIVVATTAELADVKFDVVADIGVAAAEIVGIVAGVVGEVVADAAAVVVAGSVLGIVNDLELKAAAFVLVATSVGVGEIVVLGIARGVV